MNAVGTRIGRWRKFMNPASPPGFLYIVREPMQEAGMPPAVRPSHPDRAAWMAHIRWQYDYLRRRTGWWDDDFVPYLNLMTGTEIFAEAFGCVVHRPADDMPFALACVSTPAQAAKLRVPELSTSTAARIFDMADELRREFGTEPLLRLADLQSPMDVTSLIWDKNTLYGAMLETPEAVKELSGKVKRFMTAFLDEWFRRYGTTVVAHYPDYVMERCVSFSVDEVGAVSPAMFDEFFADELNELSDRYGGLGVHCCANAKHQWGKFRRLRGLRFVNIGVWSDIREVAAAFPSVLHWHNWRPEGPVETWGEKLPPDTRIVLEVWAPGRAQAADLAGRLAALRQELSPGF
ncbi:MAG: uroporphyrinogen decarboxylase family protein [Candidatus Coatesbacteria bacterium]